MIIRNDVTSFQPNKSINIVPEGYMELTKSGKTYPGKGSINFEWSPTRPDLPGYYFTFYGKEGPSDHGGKAALAGESIAEGIDVLVRSIVIADGVICRGPLLGQVRYGDPTERIDQLHFLIPNFGFDPLIPLILKHDKWEILLKPFDNISDLFNELDKVGGFAFTYEVFVRYDEGAPFVFGQMQYLLGGLQRFLSFMRRAWCQPFFFNGMANGNLIFSLHPNLLLGPPRPLTRWNRGPLWCNHHIQRDLSNAFNRFMEIYEQGQLATTEEMINEYEHLSVIMFNYIEAGLTTFGETAIILTQSALESLAYMQAKKSGKTFGESEKTDDKIRWMLSELSIAIDIPPEAKALQYHLNIRKKNIEKPRDGPKAITYFRNGVIHPTPENLKRPFGRNQEKVPSERAMAYTITLGRMYMELAILNMLNYKGNYLNPLNGLTQQVPLKSMAISQIAAEPSIAKISPMHAIASSQNAINSNVAETFPKHHQIDGENDVLRKILKIRFKDAPPEIKCCFPKVILEERLKYFLMKSNKYILLIFVDDDDKRRIEEMIEQKRDPFPGLMTYNPSSQFLYKLDGSRNLSLQHCVVSGAFTFLYGADTTVILKNHQQTIDITEWGSFQYTIKLAYLITYGKEITDDNELDIIDELISYSINEWRRECAEQP